MHIHVTLVPTRRTKGNYNIRQKIATPDAISALYKADSFWVPTTNYSVYTS